jgi:large subunit ribosomal protein L13
MRMATYATKASDITRSWYVVDAEGQILGRLASEVAYLLRGKHKPHYVPNLDVGDHVIVINATKLQVTGRKRERKVYFRHSGWPGGAKFTRLADRMVKHSEEVIRDAVRGMLPKGPLGRQMLRKLKIYAGPDHPHAAQMPRPHHLGRRMMTVGQEQK